MRAALAVVGLLLVTSVAAEEVALVGVFPGKALVVIDGSAPKALSPGQTAGGVKLLSVDKDSAVVEIAGRRSTLRVGESPVALGGGANSQIVLTANPQGHFYADGSINGASVQFLVDTGATTVAISPAIATRAGIVYTRGERILMGTANGTVAGWRVKLDAVSVRGVTLRNVEGVVMPVETPIALLGMSFLNRMEMKREGASMTLTQRY